MISQQNYGPDINRMWDVHSKCDIVELSSLFFETEECCDVVTIDDREFKV